MIALLLGLLAALCWSAHDQVARVFSGHVGPFRLAFWVLLAGALLLVTPVLWRGQILNAPLSSIAMALLMGLVYAGALASLLKAFSLAPVSIVGPFTAGYPALVVVWGIINGLLPDTTQWLALALILAGTIVVGRTGHADGGLAAVPQGKVPVVIFSAGMASVCFAAAVILGQDAAQGLGEIETTFVSRFPAAVLLFVPMLGERRALSPMTRRSWLALVAMAAFDVVAVSAVNAAGFFPGKELGAMAISSYAALSVLFAMLFLKERVSSGQWTGIAMIVAGVGLLAVHR